MVTRAAALEIQLTPSGQIGRARVQSEGQRPDASHDEIVLIRSGKPDRDVGLAHRKAQSAPIGNQLDHDVRVLLVQRREAWRENVTGDSLRAGDANEAGKTRVSTTDTALQRQRLRFETLCLLADVLTGQRWYIPIRGAVQQANPETRFQRRESAPDSRLSDMQLLGSGGETAMAGYC
jgi:hypothetical protein